MFRVWTHESSRWKRKARDWLVETTWTVSAWFQFSNKSVVEDTFRTNYVRQPRFHCIPLTVTPADYHKHPQTRVGFGLVWFGLVGLGFYGISTFVGYLMQNLPYTYVLDMIWFGWVYGISTFVGYLMPNHLYTYILDIWFGLVGLGFMAFQPL